MEPKRYINQRLGELHVDLSDYSDEFVAGFVAGADEQRDFDPSLWPDPIESPSPKEPSEP